MDASTGLDVPQNAVRRLVDEMSALAGGLWVVEADRLSQRAFAAGSGLDPAVGGLFADATRSVPLDRTDLGIVRAWSTGEAAVSRVADTAFAAGSGGWLRAFGAARSVAVPIPREESVVMVIAIALSGDTPPDDLVAARLLAVGSSLAYP